MKGILKFRNKYFKIIWSSDILDTDYEIVLCMNIITGEEVYLDLFRDVVEFKHWLCLEFEK